MNCKTYIQQLKSADTATQLSAVRVLGLMDETQALEPIRLLYKQATDPDLKKAIAWAGERIYNAHKAGYSTLNEIFRVYKIDQEIENTEDPAEAEMMKQMDYTLSRDLNNIKMQGAQNNAKVAGAGAAAMFAMGVGMGMGGLGAGMGMIQPGANAASSNMGVSRPEVGKTRIPASAPMDMPYQTWLRRLKEPGEAKAREKAAFEISQLNNPTAVPLLAELYLQENIGSVKDAILKAIKHLYLGATYWDWSKDDTIEQEYKRRLAAAGKDRKAVIVPEEKRATSETPAEDLAKILQRAQEAREKRQKRK